MSQEQQQGNTSTPESLILPGKVEVPVQTSEDGNSVEIGYTAADPNKPVETADKDAALLAGKFKTQEDLVKAYKELEAKLGQPKDDKTKPEEDTAEPKVDPNAPKVAAIDTTDEAREMLQEKGLDIQRFTREFETAGALSAESYTKLEKAGISRAMVDAYIDGQRLMVDSQIREVKDSVGGEAYYAKIQQWAHTVLLEDEKASFNRMFETQNPTICKAAAQNLKARYEAAMGKDPAVVVNGGAGGGNDGIGRFESAAQMVEAMRDPRYADDPAYRAKVERKVANSSF